MWQDRITADEIIVSWEANPVSFQFESMFPYKRIKGLKFSFIKGAHGTPVALVSAGFNTNVLYRDRIGFEELTGSMPFFKEAIGINEKTRRDIIQAKNSGNQVIIEHLMKKVFDNYANLVSGGINQMRRMRAQVIQTGKINIVTDDGDVVVDYNVPADQNLTLSTKWNVASTDIIKDILAWQKIFTKAGRTKPTRLIMTEKTFEDTIMINTKIQNDMANRTVLVNSASNLILTEAEYLTYLKTRFGISVAFVDGQYKDETGATQSFYEDGRVSFIPEGTLGRSIYSFTPEEYDKIYGSKTMDTSVVKTGIAITTMVKEDPVTVDTKVSMIGLPKLDNPKGILVAKVY